ncbi:LppU/SCO3897 family protein [Micromonospora sp. H33]|uniref:LppU/SCO3897 family protein n=1 Tax=Micromonospora sp. H33 TaxID=3452215 RepID=UPI003F8A1E0B
MDDENASPPGRRRSFLRSLGTLGVIFGIVAAIATTVGVVFQVIERVGSDTSSPANVSAGDRHTALRANGDEQFVQVGQCVRDVGDAESPVYEIADCGPGTQRVVARVEQAVDDEKQAGAVCEKAAPDFVDFHYSNWEKRSDYVDVVFCLRPA